MISVYNKYDERTAQSELCYWLDKNTFLYCFGDFKDKDNDEFHIEVEYHADDNTWNFAVCYDDDTFSINNNFEMIPIEQRKRIFKKMKQKM